MALDRTSGYDMVVQVSEAEINNQLATAFLAGAVFPTSMRVPVNAGGMVGTADMNFGAPVGDLDRPRPRMGLTIPFVNSQLELTAPVALTIAPLGGTIVVVDAIEMRAEGTNQIARMDFNAGAPDATVSFDASTQGRLAPLLAAAGLTLNQAQNLMAGSVLTQLQSAVGKVDLTPPIPVVDDADPATIFDIDVTTVNDLSATDRDCLAFGVKMANDSGGNINGITTSLIPAGSQSVVMMSNFWLLARVMRPRVATAIGRPVTDFDTPLRLNRSVPAPGGQGTLTNLEARIIGNRIRVDGRATDSGTGWSAVSNFNFFIDIALAGGSITVTASTPSVDTDVDLEWWVWLASLGLGALFGGIVGAIVAAIVLAIVEAVAEGIANNLVAGGIGGALGGIPAIPLGPIGGSLTLTSVVLDDLQLRGSIIRSVAVPVKSQGARVTSTFSAFDLDAGTSASTVQTGTDLIWDPARGLSTSGPARLTITGASYGGLTPVQISQLPLLGSQIPLSLIPLSLDFLWIRDEIVFGMRTGEGRYAKCRAWRPITTPGAIHLEWVTYDTPVPQLDIAARWSVLDQGEIAEYITPDCQFCRSSPVRWCGVIEAWPRLMAFPVDLQWCLCGVVIEEGEGDVPSSTGPISYRLEGRRLSIETDMGQDVDCELCVSAIDSRGLELFTCIRLSQPGIERTCRKCTPWWPRYQLEWLEPKAGLAGWRPLFTAPPEKEPERIE